MPADLLEAANVDVHGCTDMRTSANSTYLQRSKNGIGTRFLVCFIIVSVYSTWHEFAVTAWSSHLDSALLSLDLGVTNFAVVDDDRIPAGAARCAIGPANALREFGLGVGEEELFGTISYRSTRVRPRPCTHNLITLYFVGLAPGAHHERVIECNHCDDIHTLLSELRQVLDVAGHVVHGAGRGKSPWQDRAKVSPHAYGNEGSEAYQARRRGPPSCWPTLSRHCS